MSLICLKSATCEMGMFSCKRNFIASAVLFNLEGRLPGTIDRLQSPFDRSIRTSVSKMQNPFLISRVQFKTGVFHKWVSIFPAACMLFEYMIDSRFERQRYFATLSLAGRKVRISPGIYFVALPCQCNLITNFVHDVNDNFCIVTLGEYLIKKYHLEF